MEQKYARGDRVEAFEDEAEIPVHLHTLWDIFTDLNKCRQSSQYGYQPLSLTDIATAFDFYEVDDRQRKADYFKLIVALDDVWVTHSAERIAARNKTASKEKNA